jgi:general secretion pathway protein C
MLHAVGWIVSAALTVLAAWFAARGIGDSALQAVTEDVDLSGGVSAADEPAPAADRGPPITADDLLAAGLFPLPLEPSAPPRRDPTPQPTREPLPHGTPSRCLLPLRVVALVAARAAPARSLAAIAAPAGTSDVRVGDYVDDAVVTRIDPERVYLRRPGEPDECFLDLRDPAPSPAPPSRRPTPAPEPPSEPAPQAATSAGGPADAFAAAMEKGITRVSDTEFEVSRSLIATVAEDPELAMASMRVAPARDGDTVLGFRLHGVRPDLLAGRLGLRNGDVVTGVNGLPMTSMDNVLRAYGLLRMAGEITVEVLGRGERRSLVYRMR